MNRKLFFGRAEQGYSERGRAGRVAAIASFMNQRPLKPSATPKAVDPVFMGRMLDRFAASGRSFDIESVCAPDAGHLFTFPGLPTMLCDSILHPLLPIYMTLGGTPSGTAAMQRRGWSAMIRFLHRTLAG